MKILVCWGTRPEMIKIRPLLGAFDRQSINYATLFTGQHEDLSYGLPTHRAWINNLCLNRLNDIVSSILEYPIDPSFTHVLVQGDTSSALAMALSAFNHGKKVIHLEAGLRTYDLQNPYPEELNRQLISKIADINFCPTKDDRDNLIREKILGEKFVVGNTIIDNLVTYNFPVSYNNEVLITLHRREKHKEIDQWFTQLDKLASENSDLSFLLFKHPNPDVLKHYHIFKSVKLLESIGHKEMAERISKCRFLISDSGGMQEEASFFKKKIIVCRSATERGEDIYSNVLCENVNLLSEIFYFIKDNYRIINSHPCPFGCGNSSEKIVEILKAYEK
jgi:UDP-N-acetylglucosamine 2-epimerase (non-hydrolysing)